jgi:hypothetical protein
VDRPWSKALEDTSFGESDVLNGLIICQHGENSVAPAGIGDVGSHLGTVCDKGFRFRPRAIVDGHVMARLQQVRRHADAHTAEQGHSVLVCLRTASAS